MLNIAGGIFFFFFFLFIFFPFESIIQNFLSRIETQSGGALRITVGEINPNIIFKSVFKNFQIHKIDGSKDHILASFPEVKIGISYLPLTVGHIRASFVAKGEKGKINGNISIKKSEYRFDTDLNKVQFSNIPYLASLMQVPVEGSVSGDIDMDIFPGQFVKNEGDIELKFVNLKIPAVKVTPYPGFDLDLPETLLSNDAGGRVKLHMEKGRVKIDDFSFPGDDLKIDLKGRIRLNRRFILSRIAVNGTFQFSEKIKEAIPFVVMIDAQKNEDGTYPITFSGRFSKPEIRIGSFDIIEYTSNM